MLWPGTSGQYMDNNRTVLHTACEPPTNEMCNIQACNVVFAIWDHSKSSPFWPPGIQTTAQLWLALYTVSSGCLGTLKEGLGSISLFFVTAGWNGALQTPSAHSPANTLSKYE